MQDPILEYLAAIAFTEGSNMQAERIEGMERLLSELYDYLDDDTVPDHVEFFSGNHMEIVTKKALKGRILKILRSPREVQA